MDYVLNAVVEDSHLQAEDHAQVARFRTVLNVKIYQLHDAMFATLDGLELEVLNALKDEKINDLS